MGTTGMRKKDNMVSLNANMYSKKFGYVKFSSTSADNKMIFCFTESNELEFWYADGAYWGTDQRDLFLSKEEADD